MAIEALYPSRRQSQRHNPLLRRERLARRLGAAFALFLGLSVLLLLHTAPGDAATETGNITRAESAPPASHAAPGRRSQQPIRVIPLYHMPEDATLVASRQG